MHYSAFYTQRCAVDRRRQWADHKRYQRGDLVRLFEALQERGGAAGLEEFTFDFLTGHFVRRSELLDELTEVGWICRASNGSAGQPLPAVAPPPSASNLWWPDRPAGIVTDVVNAPLAFEVTVLSR